MLEKLFAKYRAIVVLDTETTGIDHRKDEIIELAALRMEKRGSDVVTVDRFDLLIRLSEGKRIPPFIADLTGITEADLTCEGVSKETAGERICHLLAGEKVLVVAYNAQFDLCFLYYLLQRQGRAGVLRGVEMLDALTVYKDRRPYPHKLSNAIEAYGLQGENSHRALDDAMATVELLAAMEQEYDDLINYVNLFGYHPKYGISGPKIGSVRYEPQHYNNTKRLYE